jgi:hypothetical protein
LFQNSFVCNHFWGKWHEILFENNHVGSLYIICTLLTYIYFENFKCFINLRSFDYPKENLVHQRTFLPIFLEGHWFHFQCCHYPYYILRELILSCIIPNFLSLAWSLSFYVGEFDSHWLWYPSIPTTIQNNLGPFTFKSSWFFLPFNTLSKINWTLLGLASKCLHHTPFLENFNGMFDVHQAYILSCECPSSGVWFIIQPMVLMFRSLFVISSIGLPHLLILL